MRNAVLSILICGLGLGCSPRPFITFTAVDEQQPCESLTLSACDPSPVYDSTKVSFCLPDTGFTQLFIQDVRGQTIDTLVDSTLCAGEHSSTWHAQRFTSGVYVVWLSWRNEHARNKFLVLH